MKRADILYVQGRFDEAKAVYLEGAERDLTDAAMLERLGTIALWGNQCDEARHRFEEALRHRPWHGRRWPFDAQITFRLAVAHYRQDRFSTASSWFRRAAGPLAIGPFRDLKSLAEQTALFDDHTAYAAEGPERRHYSHA